MTAAPPVTARPPIGVLVHGDTKPDQLVPVCRRIEDAGFGAVWLAEDYFLLGGPTSAALALQGTREIPVGIGILSAVVRHPAVTAMEVATLSLAHPGRLITGIGHGVPFWTKQMGLYPKSPLKSLQVVIDSVRALLDGETLTIDEGPYVFDNVTLTHPNPGAVPLYSGVIGPKSLELSGRIADGTIMSVIAAPKYLDYARTTIAKGAVGSPREGQPHAMPTFVIYRVDTDRDVARRSAREGLAFYLQAVGPTPMTGVYGINDQLGEILALGDLAAITDALPDEWVDTFTICGTPPECVDRIKEFLAAGATSVVLAPYPAAANDEILALTAEQVLPHL
ncbi:LLM class flavin-dependent oxidoreductase [Nakamurella flava]|uniref:LLM class flavin-dependent oxidoreductase n=1 Tax=Nakamurella flava TaxID=2576308 RepID=A0A4U6QCJ2_9ACTN|nr:LLM class flavin-dependent oxidoreductase [Nakamurella flava]TKV57718.1 LLM class flavin-dependent oxidoreductase [Nakamurella flava]